MSSDRSPSLTPAQPGKLSFQEETFATFRLSSTARDFLFFRAQGLELAPVNELCLLNSISVSIDVREKNGVFQTRRGFLDALAETSTNRDSWGPAFLSTNSLHLLFSPEIYLDEERRIVGGSYTVMEGSHMAGGLQTHTKVEYHGRFVVNLDNAREILACQRISSTSGEAFVILNYPVRMYGFGGTKIWAADQNDPGLALGNWPSQGLSIVQVRPCCPFCVELGAECHCPDSMINRVYPLGPPRLNTWTEYTKFHASREKHAVITSVSMQFSNEGMKSVGSSPDAIETPGIRPYIDKLKAAYLGNTVRSSPHTFPFNSQDLAIAYSNRSEETLAISLGEAARIPLEQKCIEIDEVTLGVDREEVTLVGPSQSKYTYFCRFCQRVFPRPGLRDNHETIAHQGKELYRCPSCEKTYPSSGNLARHIKMVHEKVKRFFCSQCPMSFYTARDYDRHRTRAHSDKKGTGV